jgi:hypothetical protein
MAVFADVDRKLNAGMAAMKEWVEEVDVAEALAEAEENMRQIREGGWRGWGDGSGQQAVQRLRRAACWVSAGRWAASRQALAAWLARRA